MREPSGDDCVDSDSQSLLGVEPVVSERVLTLFARNTATPVSSKDMGHSQQDFHRVSSSAIRCNPSQVTVLAGRSLANRSYVAFHGRSEASDRRSHHCGALGV